MQGLALSLACGSSTRKRGGVANTSPPSVQGRMLHDVTRFQGVRVRIMGQGGDGLLCFHHLAAHALVQVAFLGTEQMIFSVQSEHALSRAAGQQKGTDHDDASLSGIGEYCCSLEPSRLSEVVRPLDHTEYCQQCPCLYLLLESLASPHSFVSPQTLADRPVRRNGWKERRAATASPCAGRRRH